LLVVVAAAGAAVAMHDRAARVDASRSAWGSTRSVWIAAAEHQPGDVLRVERRDLPAAMLPDGVAIDVAGDIARGHLSRGEVVLAADVTAVAGPQSLTPSGWVVVPIVESPASGASIGDRVRAVGDGVVGADGLVVGGDGDVTLVAVPQDAGPTIAGLASVGGVTLLLVP
jgi:hypothetical protein